MSSSEVKVGAFALGGAVVLAGIITFMGAFSFGKKGYELRINYPPGKRTDAWACCALCRRAGRHG